MRKKNVMILSSYWLGQDKGIDFIKDPSLLDLEEFKGAHKYSVYKDKRLLPVWQRMFRWYAAERLWEPSELKGLMKGDIWESERNGKDERSYLIEV